MMCSAPGTILKYTQLDFSVSISHLLFSSGSQSHFSVSRWPVCSTQPCQVRCLIWLLDSFPKRSEPIWLIMCLFVCKTALATFIKVWKENSYPKGHRVEEATPSERPPLPQAHLGREAEAALQAADRTQHIRRSRLTAAESSCWRECGWVSHCCVHHSCGG